MHQSKRTELTEQPDVQGHSFSTEHNNTILMTTTAYPMEVIQSWRETAPITESTTRRKSEASQTTAFDERKFHQFSDEMFPTEHTANASEECSQVPMRGLSFKGRELYQEFTDKTRNIWFENTATTADKYPSGNGDSSGSIQDVDFIRSSQQDIQGNFLELTHLFTQPWVVTIEDFGRKLEDCCQQQYWQGTEGMQELDSFISELEDHLEIHQQSIQPQHTNKSCSSAKNAMSPDKKVVQNTRTQHNFITARPAQITAEQARIREEARLNYQGIKQVCSNGGQSWFNQPSNLKSGR